MAVSQPGSRAGLITALVIFVILFFVSTALFFVKNADLTKARTDLQNERKKVEPFVKSGDLTDTSIVDAAKAKGMSAFALLKTERDELQRRIAGTTGETNQLIRVSNDSVGDVAKDLGKVKYQLTPSDPLLKLVKDLAREVQARENAIVARQKEIEARTAELQTEKKRLEDIRADYAKNVTVAQKATTEAEAKTGEYRTEKDKTVAQLQTTLDTTVAESRKQLEDIQAQVTAKTQEIDVLQKEKKKLTDKLRQLRPLDTADPFIRRIDGRVVEVAKNNVVYISLGLGDRIVNGMTFEVYDKNEGIPRSSEGDETLPMGKASIEVIRSSPGSSECKVIKVQPGQQIFNGDLLANLVYDPNIKIRFHVYGDFDLDQNGVANANETEQVKRLITQWGGIVVDKIDIDTDFVIMGKEPVMPEKPTDDDPISKHNWETAKKKLDAYDSVREKALGLYIPVMNQNRFLYYIGYFDQAKK